VPGDTCNDQPRFDRLFEYTCEYVDASRLLNHQNPLLPALLSIDIEQQARLDDHEERLKELERVLEKHKESNYSRQSSIEDPVPHEAPHP